MTKATYRASSSPSSRLLKLIMKIKGDQPWDFFGRNDAKAETQYFGHLMRRVDLLEKTRMLGGIWGQEEKGMTEDEMAGWHHRLDGHESE